MQQYHRYSYRVTWSENDEEHVGLCAEFPGLSWLAPAPEEALAISEFEIAAVLPYQRVAAAKAFALLRERFGSYFDLIDDPNDWAAQARQG
jgi:hypothetical protein